MEYFNSKPDVFLFFVSLTNIYVVLILNQFDILMHNLLKNLFAFYTFSNSYRRTNTLMENCKVKGLHLESRTKCKI